MMYGSRGGYAMSTPRQMYASHTNSGLQSIVYASAQHTERPLIYKGKPQVLFHDTHTSAYGRVSTHSPLKASPSYAAIPHLYETRDTYVSSHSHNPTLSPSVFVPGVFLDPHRPRQRFINCDDDIRDHIEEAFSAVTGKSLPNDVTISICSRDELRRIHQDCGGRWSDGIQGFAINRKGVGQSEIFVLENPLDALMLTIGHEIGHVMSTPLPTIHDEEAKAFAFSMVWMEKIREHNIADLRECFIMDNPAHNGIHDVAYGFVRRLLNTGKRALDVFVGLIDGTFRFGRTLDSLV